MESGIVDTLDARLVRLMDTEPGISVLELSRRLKVARATVQARLDRMHRRGIITKIAPHIDPAALGHTITAFIMIEIVQQAGHTRVAADMAHIPEIIESNTITGAADIIAKVVARSTSDLQRVLDDLATVPGIARASSFIVLENHVQNRVLPLLEKVASGT